jgi:catechol 2,3-dioxygenase-like lactoylglutathione lyase family enzyme
MGNPFIHVELVTDNVEKAKKFYQGLFDWKYEEMPGERGEAPYNVIKVGDGTGGGGRSCGSRTCARARIRTGANGSGRSGIAEYCRVDPAEVTGKHDAGRNAFSFVGTQ